MPALACAPTGFSTSLSLSLCYSRDLSFKRTLNTVQQQFGFNNPRTGANGSSVEVEKKRPERLGVMPGALAIAPVYETFGNPFQLPPSLTHRPSSASPTAALPIFFRGETVACISAEHVCNGGPGRIHPVDSAEPFRHPKHSIPFQVNGRWRQEQGRGGFGDGGGGMGGRQRRVLRRASEPQAQGPSSRGWKHKDGMKQTVEREGGKEE